MLQLKLGDNTSQLFNHELSDDPSVHPLACLYPYIHFVGLHEEGCPHHHLHPHLSTAADSCDLYTPSGVRRRVLLRSLGVLRKCG
jgi:hypothetical protein